MVSKKFEFRMNNNKYIKEIEDKRNLFSPSLSVILVTYQRPKKLEACLDSLCVQIYRDFEVVVVNNGDLIRGDNLKNELSTVYINMKRNYRPLIARNIGCEFAKGKIIYFIDDDAVVAPQTIEKIVGFFKSNSVIAVRGRILPLSNYCINAFAPHYDLGDLIIEGQWQEGNGAILKDAYQKIGGYDEKFPFGHEGSFLLYHLLKKWGKERVVYFPEAVIYHDYASSLWHFIKKKIRHGFSRAQQEKRYSEIVLYLESINEKKRIENLPSPPQKSFYQKITSFILQRLGSYSRYLGYASGKFV